MNQETKLKLFRVYYLFQIVLLILYLITVIPIATGLLIFFFLLPDVWNNPTPDIIKGYLFMVTIILSTFGIPLIISIFSMKAAKNISEQKKATILQIIAGILYPISSSFIWFILYKLIRIIFLHKL